MIYLAYILLAFLTVFISVKLSFYVDALDQKTNLSGAFIGGVLLAAVTSLPELFTSLTAVLAIGQPNLVQGNVLGSNVFNLCIIGGLMLFYVKGYQNAKVSKSHVATLIFGLAMYACVAFGVFFPIEVPLGFLTVNLASLFIIVAYVISMITMKNDDTETEAKDEEVPLTVGQIIVRFILFAVALVTVSILLTNVTDKIAAELNLGATVAGAIFLGVATSLPELSASFNLVRIGNYNASIGNVVGSNVFNFTILSFADFLYTKGGIYMNESQTINLILFGTISTLMAFGVIKGQKNKAIVLICSALILVSYVASIALSM